MAESARGIIGPWPEIKVTTRDRLTGVEREAARVARRHTLMIEPFADVNDSFWPRLNVVRRDYFRGRIGDLPGYGLHPIVVTDDFPQESFLKVCAVLSEKRPPTG